MACGRIRLDNPCASWLRASFAGQDLSYAPDPTFSHWMFGSGSRSECTNYAPKS